MPEIQTCRILQSELGTARREIQQARALAAGVKKKPVEAAVSQVTGGAIAGSPLSFDCVCDGGVLAVQGSACQEVTSSSRRKQRPENKPSCRGSGNELLE
ncbi:unnamed protein product [Symbiodinium natans]|uniref:Uncharacterized protein n=1 Tax=Symbiodinium natans TaxID=878477 RepID=A0A812Q4G2_9DINO|nr:unnamed protein product [Symbiodinium natans]